MSGLANGLNIFQKPLFRQTLDIGIEMTFMKPEARCTKCKYELKEKEILKGYSKNPTDYTTECPKCHTRFMAYVRLLDIDDVELGKLPFISSFHVFNALKEIRKEQPGKSKRIGEPFLTKHYPLLLLNILRYHGNYKKGQAAFKKWFDKPATEKPYVPAH